MKLFADLYATLDETNKTSAKVAALARYFAVAPPADAAWAVFFLTGRKPRQVVPSRKLREWAIEAARRPGGRGGGSQQTVPILPRLPTRSRPGDTRPRDGLAGRVEVGRHPGPAHPPGRADLSLVAQRGVGHGPLPGTADCRRRAAR